MLIFIIAVHFVIGTTAILTAFPSNTAVIVGSEVILQCRTNASKKLIWRQRLLNATEKDGPLGVIFSGNRLSHEAAQLYKIINESEGQFDLRFNATLHHGNEYMCQEPGGNNFSIEVIVLAFYESNNMFVTQENYHSDGSIAMTGTSTFLIAAGLVASILLCTCIVAVVTVKLRKSKAQQSPADHPTQDATSNPVHPTTHRPTRLTTNSHVVIELQQPVIYSDVAKKSVKRQEDLQSNDLGRDLQHPVIYSDVYDPDATQTVQASSLQCENSCKITGADGTEYSLLPVFHAKQPLAQTKAKNKLYETSVYAPIDHTIVPLPPTCHRRESEH